MTSCGICGQSNRLTARFCGKCGAPLAPVGSTNTTGGNLTGMPYIAPTGLLQENTMLNGRYLILHKVGQGGMAAVYQVRDARLPGKVWALKEMAEPVAQPAEKQRQINDFMREAQILASLDHPNIPKVVDRFSDAGHYYLVMEYVDGETLENLLDGRRDPFSEAEILPWAIQLCRVLTYLHNSSPPILFRDFKPGNIMLSRTGQIKLIDFGIARLGQSGNNRDTTVLGTPGYAAPEQYQGRSDTRSDIYALGVTLHQLLTGYDPTSTMPLAPFPPVRQLNPHVSEMMERTITRALEKDPPKRWQQAREVEATLQTIQPRSTQGGSVTQRVGQPPSKPINRSSRPTTRLLLAVAELSTQQLLVATGMVALGVAGGAWGLIPILQNDFPWLWENVPAFALAGPLAYAAARRSGAALTVHTPITIALWVTLLARIGVSVEISTVALSALLSGLVLEGGAFFLARGVSGGGQEGWRKELVGFAGLGVLGAVSFYLVMSALGSYYTAYLMHLGLWICAALLGALGWFVGDLVQQWLYMRQTGSRRS